MARGQVKKNDQKRNVTFLQVDLTKQHKAELVKWVDTGIDLWDLIEKAIDSELRFSCGYDEYNDCTQASLSKVVVEKNESQTTILVGRGPDLQKAMQALFFKYHIILQGKMEDGDLKNARGVTDWS